MNSFGLEPTARQTTFNAENIPSVSTILMYVSCAWNIEYTSSVGLSSLFSKPSKRAGLLKSRELCHQTALSAPSAGRWFAPHCFACIRAASVQRQQTPLWRSAKPICRIQLFKQRVWGATAVPAAKAGCSPWTGNLREGKASGARVCSGEQYF